MVAVATLAAVVTLASVATLAAVAAALCCRCGFTLPSLLITRRGDSGRSCGCAWLQLRLRLAAVSCDNRWFAVGREKAEASAAAAAAAAAAEMKLV